jgi:predicted RNase H-like HicB family nuclease
MKKVEKMHRYAIEILYSPEDEGFIAVAPELPGCSAFGHDEEEALREIKIAMDLWLQTAKRNRRDIPEPVGKAILKPFVDNIAKKKRSRVPQAT